MEKISYYNLFSVVTGILMIVTCSSIAYLFQKYLFSKYRNQVSNIVDKKPPDSK